MTDQRARSVPHSARSDLATDMKPLGELLVRPPLPVGGSTTRDGVPAVTIPFLRPSLPPLEQVAERLANVWRRGVLSNFGPEVEAFEALARTTFGVPAVLAVSSADIGLTLATAALGVPRGTTAVLPSFTFNSTANALRWNGLRLRFVDVDPLTWTVDPAAVAAAMGPEVGLIVGTHVFGAPCDVVALEQLGRHHGVPVLFDAAQAVASRVDGRHVMGFGDASVVSFSGAKVATAGEGGMCVLANPERLAQLRALRNYGFLGDYEARAIGLNAKMSEMNAVVGTLGLADVEGEVGRRARVVARYHDRLGDVSGLEFQALRPGDRTSHTCLGVRFVGGAGDRDTVEASLWLEGIETRSYFRPLHRMPELGGPAPASLPVTERLASAILCLPLFGGLADDDVDIVCDAVAAAHRDKHG